MSLVRKHAAWGIFFVVLALAGCGGGDDSPGDMDSGPGASDGGVQADAGHVVGSDGGPVTRDAGPAPSDGGPRDAADPMCSGPPGMYVDGSCTRLAPGLMAFEPRFKLWSDGAEKERYIYMPPGTRIDSSNPNFWVFPVGTRAYKTFSLEGRRLETRLWEKINEDVGVSGWRQRTFAWASTQDMVVEVTAGQENVLGTPHDIPTRAQCTRCHAGATSDVLIGFSAIQLNHPDAITTLSMLNTMGMLSAPVSTAQAVVPGDATVQAAVGYFHGNCSGCHGGDAPQAGFNMFIPIGTTSVTELPVYRTGVGVMGGFTRPGVMGRIVPGSPDASAVIWRMSHRGEGDQMPPLGTEFVDDTAVSAVRAWITALPH